MLRAEGAIAPDAVTGDPSRRLSATELAALASGDGAPQTLPIGTWDLEHAGPGKADGQQKVIDSLAAGVPRPSLNVRAEPDLEGVPLVVVPLR